MLSASLLEAIRTPLRVTTRPGTPTTTEFGGTSLRTTLPLPILELSPTLKEPSAGNNNIVADGGMALTLFFASTAESNSLIERDVAAKLGGFTDNKSHAVVNKKTRAKFSTGMDVYTSKKAGKCIKQAWEYYPAFQIKVMRYTMEPDGM